MPVYEYKCGSCGTVSEHLVGVGKGETDLSCSDCGSEDLRQELSVFSVSRGAAPDYCGTGDCSADGCGGACACAQ